jgi:hypothetical protein
MAKLNQLNDYANVKQPTNSDIRLPLRQIVTNRFPGETGIGNVNIMLPFSVDQSNKTNFFLYINGILLNEPDDYEFTNINGYGSSSTITLTLTPAAVMPILALNLGVATEISPNLSNLQAQINQNTIIGETKSAFLTESQFQAQAGLNWVLCDGRDVTGSAFATLFGSNLLPDMRGTVPRMKDNGKGLDPHGDQALGTYQPDQFASHNHGVPNVNNTNPGTSAAFASGRIGTIQSDYAGGTETNAKSTVMNFFIRIN